MPLQLVHPAVIHFPIVFTLSLFVIDSYALIRGISLTSGTELGRASIILATSAAISAIVAYFFGDQAFDIARAAGTPLKVLETHVMMGTITATAIALWGLVRGFVFWRSLPVSGVRSGAIVAGELILVGLVLVTAFFGGQLVYDHGVAVMAMHNS